MFREFWDLLIKLYILGICNYEEFKTHSVDYNKEDILHTLML